VPLVLGFGRRDVRQDGAFACLTVQGRDLLRMLRRGVVHYHETFHRESGEDVHLHEVLQDVVPGFVDQMMGVGCVAPERVLVLLT